MNRLIYDIRLNIIKEIKYREIINQMILDQVR